MSVHQESLIYSTSSESDIPDVCRYSPHKICSFSFVIAHTIKCHVISDFKAYVEGVTGSVDILHVLIVLKLQEFRFNL